MGTVRISLDPGLSAGVAIWSDVAWRRCEPPLRTLLLKAPDNEDIEWESRAAQQAVMLEELVRGLDVSQAYCEFPAMFNTAGSTSATATGDLFKLAAEVGHYGGVFALRRIPFQVVPVRDWKGQLKKKVVIHRITDMFGKEACKEFKIDIWDAVGIGLFKKGFFK